MKPIFIRQGVAAIGVLGLILQTGCSGGVNDAQRGESLIAVVCTIGVADKTICVLPWGRTSIRAGDAALLRRDAPRVLAWEGSTQLTSETNMITIAQCIQGTPLNADCKRLSDLEGELARLYIQQGQAGEVLRRVEVLGAFDRDTVPLRSGNKIVEVVGGPVKCDRHKIVHSPAAAPR